VQDERRLFRIRFVAKPQWSSRGHRFVYRRKSGETVRGPSKLLTSVENGGGQPGGSPNKICPPLLVTPVLYTNIIIRSVVVLSYKPQRRPLYYNNDDYIVCCQRITRIGASLDRSKIIILITDIRILDATVHVVYMHSTIQSETLSAMLMNHTRVRLVCVCVFFLKTYCD